MSILDTVTEGLKRWPQVRLDGECVVVPTHLLYPSMSVVNVYVEGGSENARVSDGGGALREIAKVGSYQFDAVKSLIGQAKDWDLTVTADGWIRSNVVGVEQVASMVAWVASASHEFSKRMLDKVKTQPASDFKAELDAFLDERFHRSLQRDAKFAGASNKVHKFDYFIPSNHHEGILIDAVLNDGSSINSVVVSHMDVAHAELADVKQRVIYDDREDWKSVDLSLLTAGAPAVAFSQLGGALTRLAAN